MTLEEMAADLSLTKPIAHLFEGEDAEYWWCWNCVAGEYYMFDRQVKGYPFGEEYIPVLFEPMLWGKLPKQVIMSPPVHASTVKVERINTNGSFSVSLAGQKINDKKLANALAKLLAWADKEGLVKGVEKCQCT